MKARILPGALAAVALAAVSADLALAKPRSQPQTPVSSTREFIEIEGDYPRGTIIIRTAEKRLYYTLGDGQAVRYPVAVGLPQFQWSGTLWVSSKQSHPSWKPTPRMLRENPGLPSYVPPGPSNPLGPRALYLGWGEYRIHGTNAPSSIGTAASSGCFRMHNADAIDLFDRVHIGAPVIVEH